MRRPSWANEPWRIEAGGQHITSLEEWGVHAAPKRAMHWKRGRSAFECASAWFGSNGEPTVPTELRELLASCEATSGAEVRLVLPEHRVRFDTLPGEPRNADVNVLAERPEGRVAISVEAKADESYGQRVDDVLHAAKGRIAAGKRTNAGFRVQQLTRALFDGASLEGPLLGSLRYQLLTGIAGAIAFANKVDASAAVFVVHEFVTDGTRDSRHLENLRDLNAVVQQLTHGRRLGVPCGGAVGPIRYAGSPLFVDGRRPALYLAKIRRVTRSAERRGLFGVDYRRLEESCEPLTPDQDWRQRFETVTRYAAGEGGGVYLAESSEGFFAITSEAAFADDVEPGEPTAYAHRFRSSAAREVWCAERFAALAALSTPQSRSGH